MRLLVKLIKGLVVLAVVLLLSAVVFIFVFNANAYKPQIIAQVEQVTGRHFSIDGNIGLTLYPWIGLKLEKTTLGNAAGFGREPFAALDSLNIKVNVLALLKQRIEISKIQLHGLKLALEINKQGKNNWSNLVKRKKTSPDKIAAQIPSDKTASPEIHATKANNSTSGFVLKSLHIKGVELKNASITYRDKVTGMQVGISALNLATGVVQFDKPVNIKLSAQLKNNQPALESTFILTTALTFNQKFSVFDLRDLALKISLRANKTSAFAQNVNLTLNTQVKIDTLQQKILIRKLYLSASGVNVQADIQISQFLHAAKIKGRISVDTFNARALSKKFGVMLPLMADKKALSAISLTANLKLANQRLELDKIKLKLDQSELTGWVHILNLKRQSLRYNLVLNRINLNSYLPPAVGTKPDTNKNIPAKTTNISADARNEKIELPLALLRKLDLQGVFSIRAIHVKAFDASRFSVTTKASKGIITLAPVTLKLFGGDINARVSLNLQKQPRYGLRLKAKNVQVGPVLNPVLKNLLRGKPMTLKGVVNMAAFVMTQGDSLKVLKRRAKGQLTLDLTQTALAGFDPEYYVRTSIANYLQQRGLNLAASIRGNYKPRKVTVFNIIHDKATIADGIISTKDFLMDSERATIRASGKVNIMRNSVDMVSSIKLSRNKTVVEKLLNKPLYVHVHGAFDQLVYDIDTQKLSNNISNLLKDEARARVNKKLAAERRKLKQKMNTEKQRLINNLRNKLKNKLKNLF